MNKICITRDDIIKRVYFIAKLVQNQKGTTMQGALTSKSDSMGGIFDRFINTISDSLVFERIILPKIQTNKDVSAIEDFYYYSPKKNEAGIAPDIFGLNVNGKMIPFTKFDDKWIPVDGMPQIEVKTYKAKDQMITLRNQSYDDQYLVMVDLDLRIDYMIPFLDKNILNDRLAKKLQMNDSIFILNDKKSKIQRISNIDFSSNNIGTIELISITNATDFMNQATFCGPNISVGRIKEIKIRKTNLKNGLLHDKLNKYVRQSPRIKEIFEFNELWRKKRNINANIKLLDFCADNIDKIEICKYNKDGIVITALDDGCTFNGTELQKNAQYTIDFSVLDRSSNSGSEYFMQKQCASHLKGIEKELLSELEKIVNSVDN